jgi:hypothetical protein
MEGSRVHNLQTVEVKHPGTGRLATGLRLQDLKSTSPVSVAAGKYVLVIASERQTLPLSTQNARAWVDAGASYICAWGPDSEQVEVARENRQLSRELLRQGNRKASGASPYVYWPMYRLKRRGDLVYREL